MKRIFSHFLIVSLVIVGFMGCDDKEEPFVEYNEECGDASLPVPIKQLIMEEFSGHKCGYCPEGDEIIEHLKEMYCDHIIPVTIHVGPFAEPLSSDWYTADYRTEDGNELSEYFTPNGYPSAMINRTYISYGLVHGPPTWAASTATMLEEDPVLDIQANTSYNSVSREMEMDVDVIFIEAINDELMLSVYFLEDSLVSWQRNYDLPYGEQDEEFYSHNHVFRDAVNGVWGERILNGQANANEVKSKSYNYTINQDWVIDNSSIVVFVYENDSKEVLQAAQFYLN